MTNRNISNYEKLQLVCKYYGYIITIIKNLGNYDIKREKYYSKFKEEIQKDVFSKQLEQIWKVLYKLILDNHDVFGNSSREQLEKNTWYIIFKLSQQLNNKDSNKEQLKAFIQIVKEKYNCKKLNKFKIFILWLFFNIIIYLKTNYKFIIPVACVSIVSGFVWHSIKDDSVNCIKNTNNQNNIYTYKTKLPSYSKNYIKPNEIKYLDKYDKVFRNGYVIKLRDLSWTYIQYKSSLYSINYLFKMRISLLCDYNTKYCNFDINKVCENKIFWLNTIKKYNNTNNKKIRIALIYIKFMLANECKI